MASHREQDSESRTVGRGVTVDVATSTPWRILHVVGMYVVTLATTVRAFYLKMLFTARLRCLKLLLASEF